MNAQEFIAAIRLCVQKQAVNGMVSALMSPPGRKPLDLLVKASEWRNRLSQDEQKLLEQVVAESVRTALFGFFCVIDGVRSVDENIDRFIITALSHNGVKVELNKDAAIDFHDEFSPD